MENRKLGATVIVNGQAWRPGDDVPDDVAAQITNPKAWVAGDEPDADSKYSGTSGTASGHKLARMVTVGGNVYGPYDYVPDEVAAQIRNPKAWEGGELPNLSAKPAAAAEQVNPTPVDGDGDGESPEAPAEPDTEEPSAEEPPAEPAADAAAEAPEDRPRRSGRRS